MRVTFRQVTSADDVATVADLAREVWCEHYIPIIGAAQVQYMLDRFQSKSAISTQIQQGLEYYLLLNGDQPQGYLAVKPDADTFTLMLSKIYVRAAARGRGWGTAAMTFVEDLCRQRGIHTIWLTVNKNNTHSIHWYERVGFHNKGPIVQDIGGGFVMDDFRLEKAVSPET